MHSDLESKLVKGYWSLYENGKPLAPLKFSNGKTQEDVVREVVSLIERGVKIVLLHGVCGSGKSAIALNIARALGRASIVVPIKSLQKQYENDYTQKKYLVKSNGERMKIAVITGRDNHDCLIEPGKTCAWPYLPDTIKITEKNKEKLREFYEMNPFTSRKVPPSFKKLRRISIAPANPYWSPILPSEIELNQLKDARKITYTGMHGREFIFYYRKSGCGYYDQYLAYKDADVIIFNSAKYLAEVAIGRKPLTEVDIVDEADEFLDNLSNTYEINLTKLASSLRLLAFANENCEDVIEKILKLIEIEEKRARAIGVSEQEVFHVSETKLGEILALLVANKELEAEIELDETNYANSALEAAKNFKGLLDQTYLTYRKDDEDLSVRLVSINLSKRFGEIARGNKAMVLMSGTLHSDEVLAHLFGIKEFARVEAETLNQGSVEILKTGKEFDCKYANFSSGKFTRQQYLKALQACVEKSEKPALVHVNAFSDLPNQEEIVELGLDGLPSREELVTKQRNDKLGEMVSEFKSGKSAVLFTTKCSRGIDFPGESCKSVVFTKYPNPDVKDTFWKILHRTHPSHYWEFYKDKARRDFLQRLYRAVRSKTDHVYVLSPDERVLKAVREMQLNGTLNTL